MHTVETADSAECMFPPLAVLLRGGRLIKLTFAWSTQESKPSQWAVKWGARLDNLVGACLFEFAPHSAFIASLNRRSLLLQLDSRIQPMSLLCCSMLPLQWATMTVFGSLLTTGRT